MRMLGLVVALGPLRQLRRHSGDALLAHHVPQRCVCCGFARHGRGSGRLTDFPRLGVRRQQAHTIDAVVGVALAKCTWGEVVAQVRATLLAHNFGATRRADAEFAEISGYGRILPVESWPPITLRLELGYSIKERSAAACTPEHTLGVIDARAAVVWLLRSAGVPK